MSDSQVIADSEPPPSAEPVIKASAATQKHLNISVLLDLSDRIDPKTNPKMPSQKERDIAAIKELCHQFKGNINAFNAFTTQARLNVFFHPAPNDGEVASIARKLNVSCKAGNRAEDAKRNKSIYQAVDSNFSSGLNRIYDLAIQYKKYPGSNIFRFMKDEVKKCIADPSLYRNVLIILTDGYVFYENEKYREKNRYSYIERSFDHFKRFRNRTLLEKEFDSLDYGLIKINQGLHNLEVLVLEVSPPVEYPIDYDIIKKYWTKWLNEMGVKKFEILKTDQPVYIQKYIGDFFETL